MNSQNGWSEPPQPNPYGDPYLPPASAIAENPYDSGSGGFAGYGIPAWRQPADRLARLAAVLVDAFLGILVGIPGLLLIFSGVLFGVAQDGAGPGDAAGGMVVAGVVAGYGCMIFSALGLLVYQCVLLSQQGQTVGKRLLNIRIVNYNDGSNPGFVKAVLLRQWVMGLLTGIPCVGAVIALVDIFMIFGAEGRCLHDQLAETIVIPADVQVPEAVWQPGVSPQQPAEYL